jgi:hypothetical protein
VAAEFAKLPSYNESDISTLVDAVTPAAIVTADTTAKLTTGWLARRAGTTAVATPADLPALDLPETLRPAFMTVWGALADGRSFEDAVAAGLERSRLWSQPNRSLAGVRWRHVDLIALPGFFAERNACIKRFCAGGVARAINFFHAKTWY